MPITFRMTLSIYPYMVAMAGASFGWEKAPAIMSPSSSGSAKFLSLRATFLRPPVIGCPGVPCWDIRRRGTPHPRDAGFLWRCPYHFLSDQNCTKADAPARVRD
jgi:hypothetical protein